MAITVRSVSPEITYGPAGPHSVTLPASQPGDRLLAFCARNGATNQPQPGGGWVQLPPQAGSSLSPTLTVLHRPARPGDTGRVESWFMPARCAIVLLAVSGVSVTDPFDSGLIITTRPAGPGGGLQVSYPSPSKAVTAMLIAVASEADANVLALPSTAWVNQGNAPRMKIGFRAPAASAPWYPTSRQTASSDGTIARSTAVGLVLAANTAPNAPAVSVLASVDRQQDVIVGVGFSDPDRGDSASSSELRWRRSDVTPVPSWSSRRVPQPVSQVSISGPLAAGSYEVQARSQDQEGATGPWSPSKTFQAVDRPPGPTLTDPAPGASIPADSQVFTFSQPALDSFEWQVAADSNGYVGGLIRPKQVVNQPGARSFLVDGLTNGQAIHVQVRATYQGLTSPWTSLRYAVSYTPPATPNVQLSADPAAGALSILALNPPPVGTQPATLSNTVHRRLAGQLGDGLRLRDLSQPGRVPVQLAPGAAYEDRTVASGAVYSYRLLAVADNGTSVFGPWVSDLSSADAGPAADPLGTYGDVYTDTYGGSSS